MSIGRDFVTKPTLPLAAFLSLALIGCGMWQQQAASTTATPAPAASAAAQSAPSAEQPQVASRHPEAKHKEAVRSHKVDEASVLSRLHETDLNEIALAKVAEQKATSPEVRGYADQIIKDRTSVDHTVIAMAENNGVHLKEASAAHRTKSSSSKELSRLNSASGAHFDKLFLNQAKVDHERLIRTLKYEREDSKSENVEVLIDQVMPVLIQDRKMAQTLMTKKSKPAPRV